MKWDLEERTEEAIALYLRRVVPDSMRVYTSWEVMDIQYPCVLIFAGQSSPVSEDAVDNDHRLIAVSVRIAVEATKRNLLEAREQNAFHRSAVIDALRVSDLKAQVIASTVADIAFSGVLFDGEWTRDVSDRRLETETILNVYCEPVTGS